MIALLKFSFFSRFQIMIFNQDKIYKKPLFVLALLSAYFCAGPSNAETLSQAVLSALNHNPTVEAAVANRNALKEEHREEFSGYFPEVNLKGAGGRVYGDNSTSRGLSVTRGAGYSYLWEGSVTLTQKLFDGFETAKKIDAASARKSSANSNILDVREELTLSTILTYLEVVRTKQALEYLHEQLEVMSEYENKINNMVDKGAADQSMVVQAKEIKVQLENTIVDIRGQLRVAQSEYAEMTGHLPEDPMNKPEFTWEDLLTNIDALVSHALKNHPQLSSAEYESRAVSYDVDAEKAKLFPDVNGELSYLKRDQDDIIGGESVDAKAVVRLNWNFSTGGAEIYRVKKKKRRYQEQKALQQELMRTIEKEVRASWHEYETSKSTLSLAHERLKLNHELFTTNEKQFEAARINLLQLMQADNARFNAKMSVLNNEYRHLASQYSLLANSGRLQEALGVVQANIDEK